MSEANHPAIAVIGSLNIDYFTRVEFLPSPGETVASSGVELFHGGKGANQAISASRQGAKVHFFGAVGNDSEGFSYRDALSQEGIDVSHLKSVSTRTGSAFITVDSSGENMIVIAPGANQEVAGSDIRLGAPVLQDCRALLAQFEVPSDAVLEGAKIANESNIPLIINPSPYLSTFPWHEIQTDYLIVNEGEAMDVLEFSPFSEEVTLTRQRMHELRIECMVVTRGGDDTAVFQRDAEPLNVETLAVLPVDTVGAGDAFSGCFAARIASGTPIEEAVRAGNCAGALTTLGQGAQDPIPDREKVNQHLEHLSAHQ